MNPLDSSINAQTRGKAASIQEKQLSHPTSTSRLFLGDCLDILPRLDSRTVDVVVTSPPYNLGIDYRSYDDTISRQEYLEWTIQWATQIKRVLKDDGSFFLNLGSKPTDPWVPFEVVMKLRQIFTLQNVIHWIKSIAIDKKDVGNYEGVTKDVTIGHYKPINSERYLNDCHEYIFHLTKTGQVRLDRLSIGVPYQDRSNLTRWKKASHGLHCRGNTWFVPYKTIRDRNLQRPHPASFPVELAEKCIKLHGIHRCQTVLDPFLGIGHAGIAAVRLKTDFLGIEIDPEYYNTAIRNITHAATATHLKP